MTIFDFQEKKIVFCRRFHPEISRNGKSIPFSELDRLRLASFSKSQVKHIGLFAVKHDGSNVPLCKVNPRHLAVLPELLPELAEKTGHFPVTYQSICVPRIPKFGEDR